MLRAGATTQSARRSASSRARAVAITVSVCSGRCGPCCSHDPTGTTRIGDATSVQAIGPSSLDVTPGTLASGVGGDRRDQHLVTLAGVGRPLAFGTAVGEVDRLLEREDVVRVAVADLLLGDLPQLIESCHRLGHVVVVDDLLV